MLTVVHDAEVSKDNGAAGGSLLDEIVRDGARRMLAAALQAEVAAYITAHADQVDEAGRRLVVRNGHHGARAVRDCRVLLAQRRQVGQTRYSGCAVSKFPCAVMPSVPIGSSSL